jgi:methyl-accepting chemotaxis protein
MAFHLFKLTKEWLNTFSLAVKFGLITAILLLAAGLPTAFLIRSQDRELAGLGHETQAVAFLDILFRLAEHETQYALEFRNEQAGAEQAQDNGPSLANLERTVEADLADLRHADDRHGALLQTREPVRALAQAWGAVVRAGSPADQQRTLDQALNLILDLTSRVVDTGGQSLDSEITSTYLIDVVTVELPRQVLQTLAAVLEPGLGAQGRARLETQVGVIQTLDQAVRKDLGRDKGFSDPEVVRRLEAMLHRHLDANQAFLQRIDDGILGEHPSASLAEVRYAGRQAVLTALEFQRCCVKVLEDRLGLRYREIRWQQRLSLGGSLAAAALALFLLAALHRGLKASLAVLEAKVAALRDGDLSPVAPPAARDELGRLAADLNAAMAGLRGMVATIQAAVVGIEATSAALNAGGADLAQRSQGEAASLEAVLAQVREVAAGASRAGHLADEADLGLERMRAGAEACREAMARLGQTLDANRAARHGVDQTVARVAEAAFEANLISVQAVDVAAAGDRQGGFALLAREVHGLGQRCTEDSARLRTALAEMAGLAGAGADELAKSGAAVAELASLLQALGVFIHDVEAMARTQAQAAEAIVAALAQMVANTEAQATLARGAGAANATLAEHARSLAGLVERFHS